MNHRHLNMIYNNVFANIHGHGKVVAMFEALSFTNKNFYVIIINVKTLYPSSKNLLCALTVYLISF